MSNDASALGALIGLLIPSVILTVVFLFFFPICSILIIILWIISFISIILYDKRHWRKPLPESHGIWLSTQTRNLDLGEYSMHGAVMGSCVKVRNVFTAARQEARSLVGGEAQRFTDLVEETRNIALSRMCKKTKKMGCNGVIGFRIITAETLWGSTEIIAYGTAVNIKGVGQK